MQIQPTLSVPTRGSNKKQSPTEAPSANSEQVNCRVERPKKIDSRYSLISLGIFTSIPIPPFFYSPISSLMIRSLIRTAPTSTNRLKMSSPT